MAEGRTRTRFAPTVGLGVASSVLAAVGSSKPWFTLGTGRPALQGIAPSDTSIDMPLALALSLVVLAGWGAMLVSRGRVRRAVLAVALVAALGLVACVATAPFVLPDDLRDGLALPAYVAADPTGWFVTAAVAAVVSAVTLVEAWRLAPRWPTMSSRYDAPATRASEPDDADLWKALDAGHDPTDPSTGEPPRSP